MNRKQLYDMGLTLGREFVSDYSFAELDEIANEEKVSVVDVHGTITSQAFETFLQFSPWEQTASEINASRHSEGLWTAFEAGMLQGGKAASWAIIREHEAEYKAKAKAQGRSIIRGLSVFHVSDAWSMSYVVNMGAAVLLHDVSADDEYVAAQYECQHGEGLWATRVRPYRIRHSKRETGIDGEPRQYIQIGGMTAWLDEFTWRGGNISQAQRILVDNGTIRI